MSNYYLLTFNEDWADEHNVPALACFTQKEYDIWSSSPTGVRNPKYDKQLEEFNRAVEAQEKYNQVLRKVHDNGTRNTPEGQLELTAARSPYPYVNTVHDVPKKFFSGISAHLGNNGDNFGDSFESYETGQALVKADIVSVFKVDEAFHKIFHKADLSRLSLSNVFDSDLTENYYDDNEDDVEEEE